MTRLKVNIEFNKFRVFVGTRAMAACLFFYGLGVMSNDALDMALEYIAKFVAKNSVLVEICYD